MSYRHPNGLQGPITDWACDAGDLDARIRGAMGTAAIAATTGGVIAGAVGALVKRPVLGAFIGAAVGWGVNAVWTAPLRSE